MSPSGGGGLSPPSSSGGGGLSPPLSSEGGGLSPSSPSGGGGLSPPLSSGGEGLSPLSSSGGGGLSPLSPLGAGGLSPPSSSGGGGLSSLSAGGDLSAFSQEPAHSKKRHNGHCTNARNRGTAQMPGRQTAPSTHCEQGRLPAHSSRATWQATCQPSTRLPRPISPAAHHLAACLPLMAERSRAQASCPCLQQSAEQRGGE